MGKLVIDGIETEPNPSKTVLEVAKELGIHIPTLCYNRSLAPYGACRICTVETIWKGRSRLRTACTYPAWEGEVKTNSEPVKKLRKLLLELMLAEAPASPEIQELAEEYGVKSTRFKTREDKKDNRCIQCGLCVRVCEDIMKVGAIGFKNRGYRRDITTPLEELSDICTRCGACEVVCPTGAITLKKFSDRPVKPLLSEFEAGLTKRPSIYVPFPQAVPNKPVIDTDACMYFNNNACRVCEQVCEPEAINYEQKEEIVEEEVGAIVLATGYELYDIENIGEYGAGKYKDVINGLQFERLLSASGPTEGEVKRPSDGKIPKRVVFVSCVGSRDPENHFPYCSKICCMYTAKHAMLYKHHIPDGEAIVFYIDTRTAGKNYEEFITRAQEEDKVLYIRGKVSKIFKDGDDLVVWGADTLMGRQVEVRCDLVVLSMAVVPSKGIEDLVRKLKIQTDEYGFLSEAHPKLRPVETLAPGFFLAGAAQAPKDIPEAVAQASGAASKVLEMFSQKELQHIPIIATVDEDLCSGCQLCVSLCPYDAREMETKDGDGKRIAKVNEILCEGCGSCVAACPSGASQQKNLTDMQILNMVKAALSD
jgi:heterodisulfide reductase subunit A-like polyferredoxin